jgi:hypothetical protein
MFCAMQAIKLPLLWANLNRLEFWEFLAPSLTRSINEIPTSAVAPHR